MKINSNTIYIAKESSEYGELENVIKKIASENEIDNVESIQISLSSDKGVIGFKVAQDVPTPDMPAQNIPPTQGMPTQDVPLASQPEKEKTNWDEELRLFQENQKKEQPTDQVAAAQTPTGQVPPISSDTQTA